MTSPVRNLLFGLCSVAIVVSTSCKSAPTWQAFEMNSLKLEVPTAPVAAKADIPAEVASVIQEMKMWTGHWSGGEMNLSYCRYNQPANLRGAFDGGVNGVRSVISDLEVKESLVEIAGRSGIEGRTSYTAGGKKHNGYMMAIVDGNQLWQIQLMSTGGTLEGVDEKVKASLKFN